MKNYKHERGHWQENNYKKEAIQAAKDLLYGPEVISQIKKAQNDAEIERIMNTARVRKR